MGHDGTDAAESPNERTFRSDGRQGWHNAVVFDLGVSLRERPRTLE